MSKNIILRQAEKKDLPAILQLVVELAVFEKEPDAVTARLSDYEDAYSSGLIGCHVMELDGSIIGMALYYETFSTWKGKMLYLEDFFVKKGHRGKGYGSMLFDAFIEEGKSRGCALLKWQVLDWNKGAIEFYKGRKAIIEDEWLNGKLFLR